MKKILLGLIVASFSASVMAAELVTECQDYFKEADAALEASLEAIKAQGLDPATVKAQYEASKLNSLHYQQTNKSPFVSKH